jgi:hypothetical protein
MFMGVTAILFGIGYVIWVLWLGAIFWDIFGWLMAITFFLGTGVRNAISPYEGASDMANRMQRHREDEEDED